MNDEAVFSSNLIVRLIQGENNPANDKNLQNDPENKPLEDENNLESTIDFVTDNSNNKNVNEPSVIDFVTNKQDQCQGFTSHTPVRVRDGPLLKGLNEYPAQLPRLGQLWTHVGSKSLIMQDYKTTTSAYHSSGILQKPSEGDVSGCHLDFQCFILLSFYMVYWVSLS